MVKEHIRIFQERQNVQEQSKFPGKFSQNSARTHTIFHEKKNIIRTDLIFQEILSKISLEHQEKEIP